MIAKELFYEAMMNTKSYPPLPRQAAPETLVRWLHGVFLFHELSEQQLFEIAGKVRRRTFDPNSTLFYQDDSGQTMYLILSGRVQIRSKNGTVIAHRGPGDYFGELALLDGKPRMADAITTDTCDLLMLDRADFAACITASPQIGLAIMVTLADRLREAALLLESQLGRDVLGRLSETLLQLVEAHGELEKRPNETGKATQPTIRIAKRVTRQELATEISAAPETVSRAMSSLRDVRAIRMEGRTIIITDIKKLERFAQRGVSLSFS